MKLHRNSQKRYYILGKMYFITTNTFQRYPYFENDTLCDLFIKELFFCKKLKNFELYGYKINPDHVHLLIQPMEEFNISTIMFSIKKHFSHNINKYLGYNKFPSKVESFPSKAKLFSSNNGFISIEGGQTLVRLRERNDMFKINMPKFKWQLSFHDHIIRDERDFYNHIKYIQRQWIHHGLKEDKWMWVSEKKI